MPIKILWAKPVGFVFHHHVRELNSVILAVGFVFHNDMRGLNSAILAVGFVSRILTIDRSVGRFVLRIARTSGRGTEENDERQRKKHLAMTRPAA